MCSFEENLCDWTVPQLGPEYKWLKRSSEELSAEGAPGPAGDLNNDKAKFFMIASDKLGQAGGPNEVETFLVSPAFLIEEHPQECFDFWFYFGVIFPQILLFSFFFKLVA